MTNRPSWAITGFGLAATLFFASGFSSLIYQVVWNRLLVFVFGSTTFATASVLAVFMGGLALGSFVAGRVSSKVKKPLLWYGILEGIIGLWAFVVPFLLDAAIPMYRGLWAQFHLSPVMFGIIRFGVAASAILLPTACMGATLPLLSKFVSNNPNTIGYRVGTLYAINTLGAVCGASWAGFMLLPSLGLWSTTLIAAAINIGLLVAVGVASRKLESAAPADAIPSDTLVDGHPELPRKGLSRVTALAILSFGISGGISMVYEVGWTKALLFVIGSGTYAFTCMLTTFLIGIFLGSLFCARMIDKHKDPVLVFAVLQLLVAGFALLAMCLYNYLPIWNLAVGDAFGSSFGGAMALKFLLAASTFVPLTLGLGATFPAIVKVCAPDLDNVGKSVGVVYSANTCGAIVGAFLAGFVLVPGIGVEKMLILAAVCNMLLGAMMLSVCGVSKNFKVAAVVAVVVTGLIASATPAIWDRTVLLLAQPLRRLHLDHFAVAAALTQETARRRVIGDVSVKYFADGISSNVGVIEHGDPPRRLIVTNGNIDGGDKEDMVTQTLLGVLPMLCNPEAKSVCVVGWATGVTSGSVTRFPGVTNIVGVDLEEKIIEASKFFHHVNHRPEEDKRHKMVINDGRNYLLLADQKFDAIISEPSNLWQAGVCNLFTREYFEICKNQLNPDGVLSLWMQTAEISPENMRGLMATVRSVFPHTIIFLAGNQDLVLVSSQQPLKVNYETIDKAFKNPEIRAELERVHITSPAAILACIEGGDRTVEELGRGTAPNTDDRNYFEYTIARTYETESFDDDNDKTFDKQPGYFDQVVSFGTMGDAQKSAIMSAVAAEQMKLKRPNKAMEWAKMALAAQPSNSQALATAGEVAASNGDTKLADTYWSDALRRNPDDKQVLLARAVSGGGAQSQIRGDLEKAFKIDSRDQTVRYQLALALADWPAKSEDSLGPPPVSNPQAVLNLIDPLLGDKPFVEAHKDVVYLAALCHQKLDHVSQAESLLREYLRLKPDSIGAKRTLGSLMWLNGGRPAATAWWQSSLTGARPEATRLREKATELNEKGDHAGAFNKLDRALALWPGDKQSIDLLEELRDKARPAEPLAASLKETDISFFSEDTKAKEANNQSQLLARLTEVLAAGFLLLLLLKRKKTEAGK
jgi:spermidine synthase